MKLISQAVIIVIVLSFSSVSGGAEGDKQSSGPGYPNDPGVQLPTIQGVAEVSRISHGEVVLFDTLYKLADNAVFYSEDGSEIPREWIQESDLVGYVINERREIQYLFKR